MRLHLSFLGAIAFTASALAAPVEKRSSSGWNDYSCKPSAAHPRPLILVHGLFGNGGPYWDYMAPRLANQGYCVFSLSYGGNGLFGGTGPIEDSARELSSFVDNVLSTTGKSQVDMVGHSEGGLMPRYYIKNLGGASKVNIFIGLAPVGHGTTLDGLGTLASKVGFLNALTVDICPACAEMIVGSSFLTTLDAGGDTVPGPTYITLVTKYDEAVTPYTSGELNGAANYVLQNFCGLDFTEHIGITSDERALHFVKNQLDPANATPVNCFG
ncbi:hypothetical protein BZG36_03281 [Bifiguratus adelaidae]|uniref:AB hydrolase-1 domain-containing protein n=1 Tax=Bifiguratus adelaidae TaxID=1938954 RepID=A0A261Y065_9FUNG|nr:hypothetical protein BZG36_03281 [Bifiguratus adelaidae]